MNFQFSLYIIIICCITINESKLEKESKSTGEDMKVEESTIKIATETKETSTDLSSSKEDIKTKKTIISKNEISVEDLQKKKVQNVTDNQEKDFQTAADHREKKLENITDYQDNKLQNATNHQDKKLQNVTDHQEKRLQNTDHQEKMSKNTTVHQEKEHEKPIIYNENISNETIHVKEAKSSSMDSSYDEVFNSPSENILLISLGGGEDEILMSQMAWLFYHHHKRVTFLVYGEHHREENLPENIKILTIPVNEDDPIRTQDGKFVSLTPEDSSRGEWVSGQILWSRVAACKGLVNKESEIIKLKPDVIVSPLFLHDVCVLSLSYRLKIPVVGVLTSRVGAWWTWAQLGVLPSLSTSSVPLTSLGGGGLLSRASNLASHYNYMSSLRQLWQVKAVNVLASMDVPSLTELYGTVSRLVLSWDPLVDPSVTPVPTAVPVGGFASMINNEDDQGILKEMVANRAGVVLVSPGTLEVWIGDELLNSLWTVLSKTPFTIFWKAKHPHFLPNITKEPNEELQSSRAKFIYKSIVPINFVLNHPRHRLLISTCGESDVMAAIYFGSPILCLPVTTDQYLAAKELQNLGVAEIVLPGSTSNEELVELLHKITTKRNYRLRARELAEEMHDQPLTPSERLLFHVENVVRRPNSVRYKINGSDLNLLQRTNADVYLVILICVVSSFAFSLFAFMKLYPIIRNTFKLKKE